MGNLQRALNPGSHKEGGTSAGCLFTFGGMPLLKRGGEGAPHKFYATTAERKYALREGGGSELPLSGTRRERHIDL